MRRAAVRLALLAGLALGTSAAAQNDAGAVAGVWRGSYTCGQGMTALTLRIYDSGRVPGAGQVTAQFEFAADPRNPGVPAGAFSLAGRYDSKSRSLSLRQNQWITQPPDYVMVDLDGTLSADGSRLSGRVAHESCTTFQLTRADK